MDLATHLLTELQARGTSIVFGMPGNHNLPLYRALAQTTLRHFTARHEQGAAFMADGYARASGRPGVCLLIGGPGLTNAATAIAQARHRAAELVLDDRLSLTSSAAVELQPKARATSQ